MPQLFIIASHIVVIVIIMILYRFPLSVGVVAVLFHGSRLVWALGARRSHVQSRKTSVFLAEICLLCDSCSSCCAVRAHGRVPTAEWEVPAASQLTDVPTYLYLCVYRCGTIVTIECFGLSYKVSVLCSDISLYSGIFDGYVNIYQSVHKHQECLKIAILKSRSLD